MSDTEYEVDDAALFQIESDNEFTDTDSEQVSDYPDTDSETVQEVMVILDPPIYDQYHDDQKIVNAFVSASLEDSIKDPYLISETKRIYGILIKFGIDYSEEDVIMYALHIANLYVNKIDFPESLRDILDNIVQYIGTKNLGYSNI